VKENRVSSEAMTEVEAEAPKPTANSVFWRDLGLQVRLLERRLRKLREGASDACDYSVSQPKLDKLVARAASAIAPNATDFMPIFLAELEKEGIALELSPQWSNPPITVDAYALGVKTGFLESHKVVAFAGLFQMKDNDEYHTSIKVSATGKVQRYSEKAHQVLAAAVAKEGAEKLWSQAKEKKVLDPRAFLPVPKPVGTPVAHERTP
jgi:hypothetical protein